jgi:diguanylate cyclase (GGDEF)-like protein
LDDFKDVNDRHGHAVGDELLQVVSSRISHAVRPGDVVARVGGDEFVIIAEGASASDLAAIARRIIVAASTPCRIRGSVVAVGASVGIAMSSGGSEGADHLLARDDAAMYRAKATGNHYAADHEGAEQVA